jgi:hypothetical protein
VFCQLFSNSLGLAFVGFISAILPTLLLACFNNFLPLLPAAIVISHFLLPAYFLNFLPLLPSAPEIQSPFPQIKNKIRSAPGIYFSVKFIIK